MSDFIQFAFAAGVMSPALQGRSDLEKYDLGLKEASNWFVDYRGGVATRAGTRYLDNTPTGADADGINIEPFDFNADVANTYLMVFVDQALYFMQDGAYVLDGGSPYSIATPYPKAVLKNLHFEQDLNTVIITLNGYEPRRLTRTDHTDWTLDVINYAGNPDGVATVTLEPEVAGTAGISYTVTSVNLDGAESIATSFPVTETTNNFTVELGSIYVSWTQAIDAEYYNVYRTLLVPKGEDINIGADYGYIGSSRTINFTDPNIIPDFTRSPPVRFDPFAPGSVLHAQMTDGGTGFTKNSYSISIAGGGTGFSGAAVINSDGVVQSITILNPGEGYTDGSVLTVTGGATDATATITVSPADGTYPRCSVTYQQRRVYAGTLASPMSIFASRIGEKDSFDLGSQETAAGPLFLTLDAGELTPIKYMEPQPNGLFLFCEDSIWTAKGTNDGGVTADTIVASVTTGTGIGDVPPLAIERERIYVESKSTSVRALRPSNLPTYYVDVDLSIFSNHYFGSSNRITAWAYAKDPHRVVWCIREDGSALAFTYVPEQNVFAWTEHHTDGQFLDVSVVKEGDVDQVYFVVLRNGVTMIEQLAPRRNPTVETMWGVDSGLSSTLTPGGAITVSDNLGEVTIVTPDDAHWTTAHVGWDLRTMRGRIKLTEYISPTSMKGEVVIELEYPNKLQTLPLVGREYTYAEPITNVSGLDHLEGRTVQILANGGEVPEQVVTGGSITLEEPASLVIAGLPFDAFVETLPLSANDAVLDNKDLNILDIALRLGDSRGVWAGAVSTGSMYELRGRTTERYDEPPRFKNGVTEMSLRGSWDKDGSVRVEKRGPFVITLLGLVTDAEISDVS